MFRRRVQFSMIQVQDSWMPIAAKGSCDCPSFVKFRRWIFLIGKERRFHDRFEFKLRARLAGHSAAMDFER
jgi:hypothetical protein